MQYCTMIKIISTCSQDDQSRIFSIKTDYENEARYCFNLQNYSRN